MHEKNLDIRELVNINKKHDNICTPDKLKHENIIQEKL